MRVNYVEYGETKKFGNGNDVTVRLGAKVEKDEDSQTILENLKWSVRTKIDIRVKEEPRPLPALVSNADDDLEDEIDFEEE